jgi:glyoxylase-like metal-dependent hydrolase (beta-lactamase superfamily II)
MSALAPVKQFVSRTGVRIYRISCQVFENLTARVYLLLGAGPPTLVDAGSGTHESTAQILTGIQAVHDDFGEPIQPADIRRIIITHGHVDHIGGLSGLLKVMPARVAIHELDQIAVLSYPEFVALGNHRLDAFFRDAGVDPVRRAALLKVSHYVGTPVEKVAISETLDDGQEIDGLRVIHTPGHSPGHICIGIGEVLLSGDHILSQTVPQQWPESTAPYTGLGHYLESLTKIEKIPGFELTLAAHEQPIRDLYARINTMRGSHHRRLERLVAMLETAQQPLSVDEMTQVLYPETTGMRSVLAITAVGSRVEYLHQRGQLTIANLDEVQGSETAVYRYRLVR